jgi:hypothetical protein
MLVPVFISLSSVFEGTKGNKTLVSDSFIATFSDGTQKILNRKKWCLTSLLRDCDLGDMVLSKNTCALYWIDWSKNPIFGSWDKHYPATTIIPEDILKLA